MSRVSPNRTKVIFLLQQIDGYPPVAFESVWAIRIGEDLYEIENVPFYAKGVALGDIVRANDDDSGVLVFSRLERSAGHSTLRVVFMKNDERERIQKTLETMGCGWEGGLEPSLISVDVPPETNFDSVMKLLSTAFDNGVLDYETGVIRHS